MTEASKIQSPILVARDAARAEAKEARARVKAANEARAAEVKAIKGAAAVAKTLASAASVSLGTAKRALAEGVDCMRSSLTKDRLTKAASELGIALGAPKS